MRFHVLFISVCVFWLWPISQAFAFPDAYDAQIERAADRYMPVAAQAWGYQILKAQYWQESHLTPDARSPVDAGGIAQFMPGTWRDVSGRMGLPSSATRWMPEYAIPAGAWYMQTLRANWSAPRPERDRHSLALASYNAGLGNLLRAQRVSGGKTGADPILAALPRVTGHHADETQTYVRRIWRWYGQMRW